MSADVRSSGASGRCVRLGLTLGLDRVVVVCLGPGGRSMTALYRTIEAPPSSDGSWPALEAALGDLRAELGASRATVDVALLPPLAAAKSIATPPVAAAQLDQLLTRNFRRYFLAPFASPLVRARATGAQSGKVARAVAACADRNMAWAVCQAVESAGLEVGSLTAAPVALAAGVLATRRLKARRVAVSWDAPAWSGGMVLGQGTPERIEAWSGLSAEEARSRVAPLAEGADETVVLDATLGRIEALQRSREENAPGPDLQAALRTNPEIVAAVGATRLGHAAPSLLPETRVAAMAVLARRRAKRLLAGAAAALVLAVGMHWAGLRRELASIQEGRAAIADQVTEALEVRKAVYSIEDRVAGIAQAEEGITRWTPVLAALAEVLPRSTYLISMTADGPSLRLDGVTTDSEGIVEGLQGSRWFTQVTLEGVRSNDPSRALAGSRFDLAMTLRPAPDASALEDGGLR